MTDIEDRLRRNLKDLAELAQPDLIRPLRVPPGKAARTARAARAARVATAAAGRGRAVRWLAPAAAAAAVAALVTGVTLAGQSAGRRPAAAGELAGLPRYYVTLVAAAQPPLKGLPPRPSVGVKETFTQTAVVHDSATGKVLARVPVSTGANFPLPGSGDITAAADDRTFAITSGASVFLLRLAADGRAAWLRRLRVSLARTDVTAGVAVSPDGTKVAMSVAPPKCRNNCGFGIEVFSVATGAHRTWLPARSGTELSLAWSGNSTDLMFLYWNYAKTGRYWLLNTAAPGANLFLNSRPLAITTLLNEGALSPVKDGRAIVTSEVRNIPGRAGSGTVDCKIVELSSRTGKVQRLLRHATERYAKPRDRLAVETSCWVESAGLAGLHVLVLAFGFGRLRGSQFTRLQAGLPAGTISWIAAW